MTLDTTYYLLASAPKMIKEDPICEIEVKDVAAKGSKLPTVDWGKYLPNALL